MAELLHSSPSIARAQRNWKLLGLATVLVMLAAVAGLLLLRRTDSAMPAIAGDMLAQPLRVARFQLTTDLGKPFTDADLMRRWTLLQFGFSSCPGICPINLAVMSQLAHKLHERLALALQPQLVFISVDPGRDTPTRLRAFAGGIDRQIIAATGASDQLHALEQSLATMHSYGSADANGFYMVNHSASIYLIDPHGRWVATLQPPFHLGTLPRDYEAVVSYAAQHD